MVCGVSAPDHRVTEWLGWDGRSFRIIQFQPRPWTGALPTRIRLTLGPFPKWQNISQALIHNFPLFWDHSRYSLTLLTHPEVWSSCFGKFPTFGKNIHVWSCYVENRKKTPNKIPQVLSSTSCSPQAFWTFPVLNSLLLWDLNLLGIYLNQQPVLPFHNSRDVRM